MWIKAFPPVGKGYSNPAASWSWAAWANCSIRNAGAICGGAAVGCVFGGPTYGQCVAVGCAGGAAAAMIGCAFDQLW